MSLTDFTIIVVKLLENFKYLIRKHFYYRFIIYIFLNY